MNQIVFYDTSNFVDFPIGGQLTSIRNFIRYFAENHYNENYKVFLVGITTEKEKVGRIQRIKISNKEFEFLPVLYRNTALNNVQNSLRIEYLKSLFKYKNNIPSGKKVLHYVHTPEAFIEVKFCHPFSKVAVFSHGSFFNMIKGFRFYKNNKFVEKGFSVFLHWMLKKANVIFTLDEDSTSQYLKYNKNIISVNNSIILPKQIHYKEKYNIPLRLLFVGRLSEIKRVDVIIEAVSMVDDGTELTIIGDGEERTRLQKMMKEKQLENRVHLMGAVSPDVVKEYMTRNDILIMNSVLEGKPMTIIEAMSYGMPIVTTNVGGIAELVSPDVEGFFTDGSAKEIVEAIEKVKANYINMSKNAIQKSFEYDYAKVNNVVWRQLINLF